MWVEQILCSLSPPAWGIQIDIIFITLLFRKAKPVEPNNWRSAVYEQPHMRF